MVATDEGGLDAGVLLEEGLEQSEQRIRVAGGREKTLRGLQSLALYPANSIFTAGYLTTGGAEYEEDRQMIEDAGFEIEIQGAKEPALA